MTLNEVMKETADAIREKTGKSELIAPINFAEEIRGITTGGESGGSDGDTRIIYLNIKAYIDYAIEQMGEDMLPMLLATLVGCVAVSVPPSNKMGRAIVPPRYLKDHYIKDIDRCAIVANFRGMIEETNDVNSSILLSELLHIGCFEITKEQFYDLNA